MIQIEIHEEPDGFMRWILRRDASIVDEQVTATRSDVAAVRLAADRLAAENRATARVEPLVGCCGHTRRECPSDCGFAMAGGWER